MDLDLDQVVLIVGTPVVTALVGAAGFWIKDWRLRRDDLVQRRRTLSAARDQVGFIHDWLAAQDLAAGGSAGEQVRSQARSDLERAYAAVARSLATPPQDEARLTIAAVVRSLLVVPLRSWQAKVVRLVYYILAVGWLAVVGAGYGAVLATSSSWFESVSASIVFPLIAVAPPWLLRKLTLLAETRYGESQPA